MMSGRGEVGSPSQFADAWDAQYRWAGVRDLAFGRAPNAIPPPAYESDRGCP